MYLWTCALALALPALCPALPSAQRPHLAGPAPVPPPGPRPGSVRTTSPRREPGSGGSESRPPMSSIPHPHLLPQNPLATFDKPPKPYPFYLSRPPGIISEYFALFPPFTFRFLTSKPRVWEPFLESSPSPFPPPKFFTQKSTYDQAPDTP